MTQYYVYEIVNPLTKKPFYIGKGRGNRCFQHLHESFEKTSNKRKWHKIKNLINSGHNPTINILQYFTDEKSAYDYEEYLIGFYGRYKFEENGILMNLCESSRPPNRLGKLHTAKTRDKMREKALIRDPFSEEHKKKLSNARSRRKDKPLDSSVKEKISKRNKSSYWSKSAEERQQIGRKISEARKGVPRPKKANWSIALGIRKMYDQGFTRQMINEAFPQLSKRNINDIIANRTWKE